MLGGWALRTPSDFVRGYTDLHEGLMPEKIRRGATLQELGMPKLPRKYLIDLGPLVGEHYLKKTLEAQLPDYLHPHEDWAMPTLAADENGKLWLLDQGPPGKKIRTGPRGVEDVMAKRPEASLAHAGSRFSAPRHNPFGIETLKKVGMSAGAVGLGASATMILLGIGGQWLASKWRVAPSSGATPAQIAALNAGVPAAVLTAEGASPKVPMLTGYKLAAAEAIFGVVAATAIQSFSKGDDIAEIVAASVGIGGVASAANGAYLTYRASANQSQGLSFNAQVAAPAAAAA